MNSLAFEVTVEDVVTVLRSNRGSFMSTEGKSTEAVARESFEDLDFDLVVQAALFGDDMDEQVDFAYDEIARQLIEMGVFASASQ
jgi:hypothetical protein